MKEPTMDDLIVRAIRAAVPPGTTYPSNGYDYLIVVDGVPYCMVWDRNHKSPHPDGGWPASWMWGQRQGKPWQAALEKQVARWLEDRSSDYRI